MLENMRHFQQVALDAEAALDGLSVQEITGGSQMTPDDQFKFLLAKAKNAAGLRQMATDCARDAAPFIHPKLANIQHSGDDKAPIVHKIEADVKFSAVASALDGIARANASGAGSAGDMDTDGKAKPANT
jgi:hypothetical protein